MLYFLQEDYIFKKAPFWRIMPKISETKKNGSIENIDKLGIFLSWKNY